MRKLRIAIDMDGIIADFTNHLLKKYFESFPLEKISESDINTFDIQEHLLNKEFANGLWYAPGFFLTIPLYEGAAETLRLLQEDGHQIVILTSPSTSWSAMEKMQWLGQHLSFLPGKVNFAGEYKVKNLIITSEKHMVRADVLIDDFPENVKIYKEENPKSFITSLSHAYNNTYPLYDFMPTGSRYEQWEQIRSAITKLAT